MRVLYQVVQGWNYVCYLMLVAIVYKPRLFNNSTQHIAKKLLRFYTRKLVVVNAPTATLLLFELQLSRKSYKKHAGKL